MTRFLKLVRHEDGKWKALPTETDDIAQVSLKERQYAPIDPDQLLKALDSLLSKSGGIKSVEDVPRLASLSDKLQDFSMAVCGKELYSESKHLTFCSVQGCKSFKDGLLL
ncbi:hypothetical protein HNY73_002658 [Argiope bruennichi]|uniref:Uncharacterized protein n=1 Tax=Argiope bruennichi TaxID=94029 RepID=A0A8T0FUD7_ARGBR|nr:hypothetical protein HNY73_002658 [Argiope bruennichi]